MRNAKHSSGIGGFHLVMALAAMAAVIGAIAPTAQADPPVVVTGSADIKVWVDRPWAVHPSYDDVVISVHAARSCYVAVFVIDTHGFVHVVRPASPFESAWLRGGMTYRFEGRAMGLHDLGGRGIAHVFAVGSPYPFDFTPYGDGIFVGRYGYRIVGDPYLAIQDLYAPILPPSCSWDYVRVGSARFYVREWMRYPVYLCFGHGNHGGAIHVRVGGNCQQCYPVYREYRVHVNDPHEVLRPVRRYKDASAGDYSEPVMRVRKTREAYKYGVPVAGGHEVNSRAQVKSPKIVSAKRTGETADRLTKTGTVKVAKNASKQTAAVKRQTGTAGKTAKTSIVKGKVSR